ncbi:MAG: phosphatase PAP2 family protein [Myxococcota bacterium]
MPRETGLPLRLTDVVVMSMGALAVACLLVVARWTPGAMASIFAFSLIAAGPLVFRALARRFPKHGVFDLIASFWLLPAAVVGHTFVGPLADAVHPALFDRHLAYADARLFGVQPAVWLEARVPPGLVEVLLVCYYTYFLWPLLLGLVLYFGQKDRRLFEQYVLALALGYSANFVLYALVPAVGPRFFLAGEFNEPLRGLWLTPWLDSVMRLPRFTRDCFPSGHTATTLTVLFFAYRRARRFFWVMFPFAVGLIGATVVGRFHYAVDLLAALPLVLWAVTTAVVLSRVRPKGVLVTPSPRLATLWREGIVVARRFGDLTPRRPGA